MGDNWVGMNGDLRKVWIKLWIVVWIWLRFVWIGLDNFVLSYRTLSATVSHVKTLPL
jgi:hypothetical protein